MTKVTRPRGRPPKTEPTARDLKIIAMRKKGATWREIGAKFGLTPQAVSQLVNGTGLLDPAKSAALKRPGPRGPTLPVSPALLKDIRILLNAGWTHRTIASELHVSLSTVARARKEK